MFQGPDVACKTITLKKPFEHFKVYLLKYISSKAMYSQIIRWLIPTNFFQFQNPRPFLRLVVRNRRFAKWTRGQSLQHQNKSQIVRKTEGDSGQEVFASFRLFVRHFCRIRLEWIHLHRLKRSSNSEGTFSASL